MLEIEKFVIKRDRKSYNVPHDVEFNDIITCKVHVPVYSVNIDGKDSFDKTNATGNIELTDEEKNSLKRLWDRIEKNIKITKKYYG